MLVIIIKHYYY